MTFIRVTPSGQNQSNKRMCYWEDEKRHHHPTAEQMRQGARHRCTLPSVSRSSAAVKSHAVVPFVVHAYVRYLCTSYSSSTPSVLIYYQRIPRAWRATLPPSLMREIDRDTTVHLAFPLPPWTPAAAVLAEITSVQIICANFTILVFMNLHKFHKLWKKSLPF